MRCPCWNYDNTQCEYIGPDGVCKRHREILKKYINIDEYSKDLQHSEEILSAITEMMRIIILRSQKLDVTRHYC
jgi:hypothetical protein